MKKPRLLFLFSFLSASTFLLASGSSDSLLHGLKTGNNYVSLRLGAGGFKNSNAEAGIGYVSLFSWIKRGAVYSEAVVEFSGFKQSSLWGPKLVIGATHYIGESNFLTGINFCSILYRKEGRSYPVLRPELVVSFQTIFDLSYGYSLYPGKQPDNIYNTHTITLIMRPSVIIALLSE